MALDGNFRAQTILELNREYFNGKDITPPYHLPGNVISAAVGLVYNNLQPDYKLPSSTRFGQYQKFGNI